MDIATLAASAVAILIGRLKKAGGKLADQVLDAAAERVAGLLTQRLKAAGGRPALDHLAPAPATWSQPPATNVSAVDPTAVRLVVGAWQPADTPQPQLRVLADGSCSLAAGAAIAGGAAVRPASCRVRNVSDTCAAAHTYEM